MIIANKEKRILFISQPYKGSYHDYKILKNEFNPRQANWFIKMEVYVDLGFLGIQKDFISKIRIPFKRKKKQELEKDQKEYNKSLSRTRVKVEHAIGGLKRFRILSDRLRMRSRARYHRILGICAALWNYQLTN